ncbi:MAG: antibiotic biosynthesis monooxygenase [Rhodanobacteraceae bacterium]
MLKYALYAHLEAKPGKEAEVERLLAGALPVVQKESETITWYAMKMGPTSYGIFDTFEHESGREAHLNGEIAAALQKNASELLASPPKISKVELLCAKLPG